MLYPRQIVTIAISVLSVVAAISQKAIEARSSSEAPISKEVTDRTVGGGVIAQKSGRQEFFGVKRKGLPELAALFFCSRPTFSGSVLASHRVHHTSIAHVL